MEVIRTRIFAVLHKVSGLRFRTERFVIGLFKTNEKLRDIFKIGGVVMHFSRSHLSKFVSMFLRTTK